MSIGILLITHPGIGKVLLKNAFDLIGACPLRIECLEIPLEADREAFEKLAAQTAKTLDDGNGVLVLTDAFGSTPSNIACQLTAECQANVVSGLNLPMLIRVFNYARDDLAALTHKAAEGAMRGIQVSHAKGVAS
jgi:PTS system ascorbate-specific IIA component